MKSVKDPLTRTDDFSVRLGRLVEGDPSQQRCVQLFRTKRRRRKRTQRGPRCRRGRDCSVRHLNRKPGCQPVVGENERSPLLTNRMVFSRQNYALDLEENSMYGNIFWKEGCRAEVGETSGPLCSSIAVLRLHDFDCGIPHVLITDIRCSVTLSSRKTKGSRLQAAVF